MSALELFALVLFAVTYILMFTLQKFRPYIALGSAFLFVAVGSIGIFPEFSFRWNDALGQIDWNVILMIAGTMGTVYLFIQSKMPQKLSDLIVSKVHTSKWIIVSLSLFAGIISAFVDNVATVLMIAPVAIALCKKLKTSPVTAIICISVSSNLQGAATLVGDTTSILLGKAAGLDFMGFFFTEGKPGMFWVTEAGAIVSAFIILWMCRKDDQRVDSCEITQVEDLFPSLLLVGTIVTLILASFIPYASDAEPGEFFKPDITNGLICMTFFLVGILRQCVKDRSFTVLREAVREIDFYTIFLLAGLFIVIGGIQEAGIIDRIGSLLASMSGDGSRMSIFLIYTVIVWASVLFSAFIDNIPYTATMLPVVAVIAEKISAVGTVQVHPNLFYFGLLVGATLGGNLTPIGASANITGLSILRREGYEVKPSAFMKYSVPFTLSAVLTGYLLVWFIWM